MRLFPSNLISFYSWSHCRPPEEDICTVSNKSNQVWATRNLLWLPVFKNGRNAAVGAVCVSVLRLLMYVMCTAAPGDILTLRIFTLCLPDKFCTDYPSSSSSSSYSFFSWWCRSVSHHPSPLWPSIASLKGFGATCNYWRIHIPSPLLLVCLPLYVSVPLPLLP